MAASISTGSGDQGLSSDLRSNRIPKSHPLFQVLGDLDELNSHLGLCKAYLKRRLRRPFRRAADKLAVLQPQLQSLMSYIASYKASEVNMHNELDGWIEEQERHGGGLPPVLVHPGRNTLSASIHIARTVCRRAERSLESYIREEKKGELRSANIYLNRLSDYLFLLAEGLC